MSFSKFATSVLKVTIDVPKVHINCLAPPGNKVSALPLNKEGSTNKEKHSLHNFAALQSRGRYSKKFLLTSIVTFDTKEANLKMTLPQKSGSRKKKHLHQNHWSQCHFAWTSTFYALMHSLIWYSPRFLWNYWSKSVAVFLGYPVYQWSIF